MDEYVFELLTSDYCCDVAMPHLPKRMLLEDQSLLTRRISALEDDDDFDLDAMDEEDEDEEIEQVSARHC
jgi:pre-mRNA-splicing factor 38A